MHDVPHPTKLALALRKRLKADKLTLTAAAEELNIDFATLKRVVDGGARPNSRTYERYADFLGVSLDDVQAMVATVSERVGTSTQAREAPVARQHRQESRERNEAHEASLPKRGLLHRAAPSQTASKIRRAAKTRHATTDRAEEVRSRSLEEGLKVLDDRVALAVHASPNEVRRIVERVIDGNEEVPEILKDDLALTVHALDRESRSKVLALVASFTRGGRR